MLTIRVGAVAATVVGLAVVLGVQASTAAQAGVGTVTGRVIWGPCVRGPVPLTPGEAEPGAAVEPAPAAPPDAPQGVPEPGAGSPGSNVVRPVQPGGVPAGAVLVAVQNTSINSRTDETGAFTLASVPAGMYLTVAAGPVARTVGATASQPNVFVAAGQTTNVGTLVLGGTGPVGFPCRIFVPQGTPQGVPDEGNP